MAADDVLTRSRAGTELPAADLDAARARRASLHRACSHLRGLLAGPPSPAGGGPASDEGSRPALDGALGTAIADVARLWDRHVDATEAPDGLLAQILTDAPWLAGTVGRFRREHPAITGQLLAACQVLERAGPDVDSVRRELVTLLDGIDKHRRGGHDLIYQAYCVDIGLGE